MKHNPAVADATCEVHFTKFGDSALEVMLYFFLDVPDWTHELQAKAGINCEIMRLAEQEGVDFAYPSMTVYMPDQQTGPAASAG